MFQVLASSSLSFVCLSHGMAFTFTGTLLPQIQDFVSEENGTWLGKRKTGHEKLKI